MTGNKEVFVVYVGVGAAEPKGLWRFTDVRKAQKMAQLIVTGTDLYGPEISVKVVRQNIEPAAT